MVIITGNAKKELDRIFGDKKPQLRIFLDTSAGMRLAWGEDHAVGGDRIFETEGYTFVVDRDLIGLTGDLRINMTETGLELESQNRVVCDEPTEDGFGYRNSQGF
ncbi:IscA/HesB family protein [Pseudodesulfovibrio sp.]|uniref:IscA/HesB family protein n=1 Tax=unclassified Pseudodesulfovibrio TaxID=2661612 RepID=UPI003B004A66